jgi:hypothetical protein
VHCKKHKPLPKEATKTKQNKGKITLYAHGLGSQSKKQEMHEEKGKTSDYKCGNELKCILTGLLQERSQLSNM